MLKRMLSLLCMLALLCTAGLAEERLSEEKLLEEWDVVGRVPGSTNYLVCRDEKWGMIDAQGNVLLPIEYDAIRSFSQGHAVVNKDGLWGMIDTDGALTLDTLFRSEPVFVNGLAVVQIMDPSELLLFSGDEEYASMSGVIDRTGEYVVPLEYTEILLSDDGSLMTVMKNRRYGVLDAKGEVIADCKYDYIGVFCEGYAEFGVDTKLAEKNESSVADYVLSYYGIMDSSGETVVPAEYERLNLIGGGLAIADMGAKNGIIDMKGEIVVPFEYSYMQVQSADPTYITVTKEEAASAREANMSSAPDHLYYYGMIDRAGNIIIPTTYNYVQLHEDGLVEVRPDSRSYGYLNLQGETVIEPIYANIRSFVGDCCAALESGGGWGVLNREGETVLPFEYSSVKLFPDGRIRSEKGETEKWYQYRDGKLTEIEG